MPLDPDSDPMRPPDTPTKVYCIHCGIKYMSDRMEWRVDDPLTGEGFWCCGIEGCDGIGFGVDVHPLENWIDEHGNENGWFNDDGTPGSLGEILRREEEERAARGDDDDDSPITEDDVPF